MLIEIINRVLTTLFFMALLVTLRHVYYFIQAYFISTEEEPVKYKVSTQSLIWLCLSMAYVFTALVNGVML
jgi:hypothetical protein